MSRVLPKPPPGTAPEFAPSPPMTHFEDTGFRTHGYTRDLGERSSIGRLRCQRKVQKLSKSCNDFGEGHQGSRPYTSSSVWVPTYTLALATVGTVNFTARPAVSRNGTIPLL